MANVDLFINVRDTGIQVLRQYRQELAALAQNTPDLNLTATVDVNALQSQLNQVNQLIAQSGAGNVTGSALDQLINQAEELRQRIEEVQEATQNAAGTPGTTGDNSQGIQQANQLAESLNNVADAQARVSDAPTQGSFVGDLQRLANTDLTTLITQLDQTQNAIAQATAGGQQGSPLFQRLEADAQNLRTRIEEVVSAQEQLGQLTGDTPDLSGLENQAQQIAQALQVDREGTIIGALQDLANTDLDSLVTQLDQTQNAIAITQSGGQIGTSSLEDLEQDAQNLRTQIDAVVDAQQQLVSVTSQNIDLGSIVEDTERLTVALGRQSESTFIADLQRLANTDLSVLREQLEGTRNAIAQTNEGDTVAGSPLQNLEEDAQQLEAEIQQVVAARQELTRVFGQDISFNDTQQAVDQLVASLNLRGSTLVESLQNIANTDLSSLVTQLETTQAALARQESLGNTESPVFAQLTQDAEALQATIDEVITAQQELDAINANSSGSENLRAQSEALSAALNAQRQGTVVQEIQQLANTDLNPLVQQLSQTQAAIALTNDGANVGNSTLDELTLDAERLRAEIDRVLQAQEQIGRVSSGTTDLSSLTEDSERLAEALDRQRSGRLIEEVQALANQDLGQLNQQLQATQNAIQITEAGGNIGDSTLSRLRDDAVELETQIEDVIQARAELGSVFDGDLNFDDTTARVEELQNALVPREGTVIGQLEQLANTDLAPLLTQLQLTQNRINQLGAEDAPDQNLLNDLEEDARNLRAQIEQVASAQRDLSSAGGTGRLNTNQLGLSPEAVSSTSAVTASVNENLARTSRLASGASQQFRQLAQSAVILDGPLGGVGGRLRAIAVGLNQFGAGTLAAGLGAAGLVFGLTRAVAAAGEAQEQFARLNNILEATGGVSGRTSAQLNELTRELAFNTLTSVQEARDAAGILLTFRSISGETFDRTLAVAQDLAAVFGQSLSSSASQLGKALEDPVNGLNALRRVGVSFTNQQREQITVLAQSGNVLQAQGLILEEIERQVGGAADASGTLSGAVDTLGEQFTRLLEEIGDGVLLETTTSLFDGLAAAIGRVADRLEDSTSENFAQTIRSQIEALVDDIDGLEIGTPERISAESDLADFRELQQILEDGSSELERQLQARERLVELRRQEAIAGGPIQNDIGPLEAAATALLGPFTDSSTRFFRDSSEEIEALEQSIENLGGTAEEAFERIEDSSADILSRAVQRARENLDELGELTTSETLQIGAIQADPNLSAEQRQAIISQIQEVGQITQEQQDALEAISLNFEFTGADSVNQAIAEIARLQQAATTQINARRELAQELFEIERESQANLAQLRATGLQAEIQSVTAVIEQTEFNLERSYQARLDLLRIANREELAAIQAQIAERQSAESALVDSVTQSGGDVSANTDIADVRAEIAALQIQLQNAESAANQRVTALSLQNVQDIRARADAVRDLQAELAALEGNNSQVIDIQFQGDVENAIQRIREADLGDEFAQRFQDQLGLQQRFDQIVSQIDTFRRELAAGSITEIEFTAQTQPLLDAAEEAAAATGNIDNVEIAISLRGEVLNDLRGINRQVEELQARLAALRGDNVLSLRIELDSNLDDLALRLDEQVRAGVITRIEANQLLDAEGIRNDFEVISAEYDDLVARLDRGEIPPAVFTAELDRNNLFQRIRETAAATGDFALVTFAAELDEEAVLARLTAQIDDLKNQLAAGDINSFEFFARRRDLVDDAQDDATAAGADGQFVESLGGVGAEVDEIAQKVDGLRDSFAGGLTDAILGFVNGTQSAGEAFAAFAASFLQQIAQMILQQIILNTLQSAFGGGGTGGAIAGAVAQVNHSGGVVGEAGRRRVVDPRIFTNARRLHEGGVAGLGPNEVPTILERGEEVVTRDDPRNILNGGGGGQGVQVNNFIDIDSLRDAVLQSDQFDRRLTNGISANRDAIRAELL